MSRPHRHFKKHVVSVTTGKPLARKDYDRRRFEAVIERNRKALHDAECNYAIGSRVWRITNRTPANAP